MVLALSLFTLTACSSDPSPAPDPIAMPSDVCPIDGISPIPAECVPGDRGFDVVPVPVDKSGAPASSASIPAVVLTRQPGDLVAGGNDVDPSLTTRTFTVTVAAGARLSATSACRGFAELEVRSVPPTKIAHTLPCGQDQAIDLTVLDPTLLSKRQTYQVTVTAPAPSRWFLVLGSVTRPAPTN